MSQIPEDAVFIGDEASGNDETPEKIIFTLDGETEEVEYTGDDPILETLINAGFNPPYSCMDGNCMACMAKVVEGRVYQEDPGILTDDNIEERETLTCQARPVSQVVRIDYDDIV